MKVEQALRLLPDLEALAPLRARILRSASADDAATWGSSGPYLTVGKRELSPAELRRRASQDLQALSEHVASLYDAYIDALECLQRDDAPGAIAALLEAGRREQRNARGAQACAWFDVALALAAGLPDRKPEIQTLLELGRVSLSLARFDESARHCQRALALAEAEFDQAGAIAACKGLGRVALERGEWAGAHSWFSRALRLAEAGGDAGWLGRIHYHLGDLARRTGELDRAGEHLRQAREFLEKVEDARRIGRVLNTQGLLEAARGDVAGAVGAYREALAWSRRGEREYDFQVEIALNLASLLLDAGRLLEAEAELRRAEQTAVAGDLTTRLASVYVLLGGLRGRQNDETGFVFFEQAMELARTAAASPLLEADVCREYGLFRQRLGQSEEARAYLERAREIYASFGLSPGVDRVQAALGRLTA